MKQRTLKETISRAEQSKLLSNFVSLSHMLTCTARAQRVLKRAHDALTGGTAARGLHAPCGTLVKQPPKVPTHCVLQSSIRLVHSPLSVLQGHPLR